MDPAGALVEQGGLLADVILAADPTTPVTTCPGWTLRQLATHVGRGDRWAAQIVATGGPVDTRAVADGRAPAEPAALASWMRGGAELLIDNVHADPDKPVWTFFGPRPAAWWIRRRLHESTVHRADATLAVGAPFHLAPELAADGISEFLDLLAGRGSEALPGGQSVHLHATDGDLGGSGEWVLRGGPFAWEHGHEKATAAVRGRVAELFLGVTRRIPGDDPRLEVLGEAGAWCAFLDNAAF
jgi:uncharacterized protein (TIGR03083 family)